MIRVNSSSTEGSLTLPNMDASVVDYLRKTFPNKLPDKINIPDRELGALFGRQEVIEHLASLLSLQQEELLD